MTKIVLAAALTVTVSLIAYIAQRLFKQTEVGDRILVLGVLCRFGRNGRASAPR